MRTDASFHGSTAVGMDEKVAEGGLRPQLVALLPELRGFARFLARDRSAADDLVQETVVRALAGLDGFEPGTNLKAWVFAIQRNAFYEQTRRSTREKGHVPLEDARDEAGPEVQEGRTGVADLQRALWSLPPILREALVLVGAQEMSYEEAAQVCAVPVGTMKARVSRARTALARTIAEAGG